MFRLQNMFYILAVIVLMILTANPSHSRIINISATEDNIFTPNNVSNAIVGDTVKWNWTGGSHTTTCDGQQGTLRPSGAAPWNSPLNSVNPVFTYVITVAGTYNYICEPHSPSMSGVIVAAPSSITQLTELVNDFTLSQNYPNPFNPVTIINFSLPVSSLVILKIYNNIGQEVETLVNQKLSAGSYNVDWNASKFTSGIYYYKIQSDRFTQTKKMMLIK